MDPNVVAALISLLGSATLASAGALARWRSRRAKHQNISLLLSALSAHPVMLLETDASLTLTCHDEAKANLLNAIKIEVVCRPTRRELEAFLKRLQSQGRQLSIHTELLCEGVLLVRQQLRRTQESAALGFPEGARGVIQRLAKSHADSLTVASDLFQCSYSPEQLLELIFNIFYVSTFGVLSQWAQTANQLNGHLNGLEWNAQKIGYSFEGTITDVLRIMTPALLLMQEALKSSDCCACVLDAGGRILGTCGTLACLGFSQLALSGVTLGALQLGLENLRYEQDFKTMFLAESSSAKGDVNMTRRSGPVKDSQGSLWDAVVYAAALSISLPVRRKLFVALLLRSMMPIGSATAAPLERALSEELAKRAVDGFESSAALQQCSVMQDVEENWTAAGRLLDDAHTRLAYVMSTLTHPVRRIVAGCSCGEDSLPLVEAVMDGSPDLPAFAPHRHLHSQMLVPAQRILDACARCSLRMHCDLLKSSALTYNWHTVKVVADFFVVGCHGRQAVLTVHRPAPPPLLEEGGGAEQGDPNNSQSRPPGVTNMLRGSSQSWSNVSSKLHSALQLRPAQKRPHHKEHTRKLDEKCRGLSRTEWSRAYSKSCGTEKSAGIPP